MFPNKLKIVLELIIHRGQTGPLWTLFSNLGLSVCKLYSIDVVVISLDQEKSFDTFLLCTLKAFGFGEGFYHCWICCMRCLLIGEGGWGAELSSQSPESYRDVLSLDSYIPCL